MNRLDKLRALMVKDVTMHHLSHILRQQSTLSAVVLAVILVFAAQAAGIDLVGITQQAGQLLSLVAAACLVAKGILPDPTPLETPPPVQSLSPKAVRGLEILGSEADAGEQR